jgi:AcrR family transcriptional regulator
LNNKVPIGYAYALRWEHGSEERLKKAAIELFDEQGFENTSVIEISERARVTTRTFFRYFSDKREVLFAGSDELRAVLVEKILQAPDVGEPLQVVIGALSEFDWENLGSRNSQRQRQAVIAANPELLERDLIKNHSIAVGFIDALRQRGVDADIARLAAHVGIQLFITAYVHWLEAGAKGDLAIMSESVVSLLASIVPANAQPPSSRQKSTRVPANQADPSPRRGRGPHDSRRGHRR